MKIGIFTDTYYPQINGVATSTRILATELRKQGHKVYIFTTSDPNITTPEFDVFRLPSIAFIFLKSHRASIMYSPKALSVIKKMELDIVHTQSEFSLGTFGKIVAIRFGIPHVHTFHTMYPDYVHYLANGHLMTPKMANDFCKFCCNVAKVVIAPTDKVKSYLQSIHVKRDIEVIPTGMDFEAFRRENFNEEQILETRKLLGLTENDKVIVTIGRVAREKSMDVLVNAMPEVLKRIKDAKLVIVGDGPVKKALMKLASDIGVSDNVIFAGAKPWSTIGIYYAMGDVFANASLSEAQGLTFIEAMAARTAVIAKNDPCLEGFITNDETGFIFNNDEELPDVVERVINDKAKLKAITDNAYENIQRFSSKKFAESVLGVYEKVIEEKAKVERPAVIRKVVHLQKKLAKRLRKR